MVKNSKKMPSVTKMDDRKVRRLKYLREDIFFKKAMGNMIKQVIEISHTSRWAKNSFSIPAMCNAEIGRYSKVKR
jgi:hypothetical protein